MKLILKLSIVKLLQSSLSKSSSKTATSVKEYPGTLLHAINAKNVWYDPGMKRMDPNRNSSYDWYIPSSIVFKVANERKISPPMKNRKHYAKSRRMEAYDYDGLIRYPLNMERTHHLLTMMELLAHISQHWIGHWCFAVFVALRWLWVIVRVVI